jgi:hypothetical protein
MIAQQALYEVLISRLRNASPLWGVRVEPLTTASSRLGAPGADGKRKLYVVFFEVSGGANKVNPHRKNAEFVISVKAVGGDMANVMAASAVISTLLDESGRQDVGSEAANPHLPIHADWDVTTITEDRDIWLEELFSGAESIYHAGHQYQVNMEKK